MSARPIRPVRVSELSGAAAAAVKTAREGDVVDVTSRGTVVARIVPAAVEETSLGGMRMLGTGTSFQVPRAVVRIAPDGVSGADQVIADRAR